MKKALSVVLALVMVFSCFGVIFASAEDVDMGLCKCKKCTKAEGCHCCIYCPYLDKGYITSCVKFDEEGNPSFCCADCTGIFPCNCGVDSQGNKKVDHDCCYDNYENIDDGTGLPILTPDQQNTFIQGFQNVLKKVSDIFDSIFNAIFEFLRIKDVFPDLFG